MRIAHSDYEPNLKLVLYHLQLEITIIPVLPITKLIAENTENRKLLVVIMLDNQMINQ